MQQLTPVVQNFIIINVLVYLATAMWYPSIKVLLYADFDSFTQLGRYSLAAFLPTSKYFYPVQVVSNIFMHSGIGHLFFNMLSLYFFGGIVESAMGMKRFFIFYMVCGFGALAVFWVMGLLMNTVGVNVPVMGASGAIYGVLIACAFIAPDLRVMLLIPPIPLKLAYLAPGLVALDLYAGFSGADTDTAHFAHVGGALVGLLLVLFWHQRGGLYRG